jgi:gamma-glutamyltranspeptidase/glutathione hydrolase
MISAGHYLAAEAGFAILEAGGNAVDAGVAAGIALGVVQSDIVNVAGVAPIILYLAERDEVVTISGLGTWPKAASLEFFETEHGGTIPVGLLRTVVPAAPDAWITALERFGTMTFGEVAGAATRFAAEGFVMYPLMAEIIETFIDGYRTWSDNAAIYLPDGAPPKAGEVFVQADLGRTLRYMADQEKAAKGDRGAGLEAARDAFYRGDVAATIVNYHRDNGGFLTAEDMAAYRSAIEPPVRGAYHGIDVYTCGPWCQGPVLLQMLHTLDGLELEELGHNSPAYIHTLTEAMKLAFADRERHYGDPRMVEVPLEALLSSAYSEERRGLIRPDRAWPEMPPAGDPMGAAAAGPPPPPAADGPPTPPRDTSYVCVVDRHGNAFSATPSDVSSDTPVIPGTGLCPSSRGSQSWAVRGHASAVAPGKRPRLTPNPALAIRDGRIVMPFGTPGGDVQAQAMLQVFLNVVRFGMPLQEAIEAPRFATLSFPNSFEPHAYHPGLLNLEGRIEGATAEALAALGHEVELWPEQTLRAGSVCMIAADRETGVLQAGADARRPAYALGW